MSERRQWGERLQLGEYVDALDTAHDWCEAVVIATKKNKVHVHYRGWGSSYNEWIPRQSKRLAPPYTHVPNWRMGLQKGDHVLVGTHVKGRKTPLWRDGRVNRVRHMQGASNEPAQVQVKLCDDGEMRWMSPQDELLRQGQGSEEEDENNTETDSTTAAQLEEVEVEAGFPAWTAGLTKGSLLEVQDSEGRHWYEGRVLGRRVKQVCVRYRGWPFKYDEWIDLDSDRIAQPHTHLGKWRDFKKGDRVQVGFRENPNSDTASHWEEGSVVSFTVGKQTKRLQRVKIQLDASIQDTKSDNPSEAQHVWRDVQDDYIAKPGVPTFPLQPGLFDSDDASSSESGAEDAPPGDILDLAAPDTDANEREDCTLEAESKDTARPKSQGARATQLKMQLRQVFTSAMYKALELVDETMCWDEERNSIDRAPSQPEAEAETSFQEDEAMEDSSEKCYI